MNFGCRSFVILTEIWLGSWKKRDSHRGLIGYSRIEPQLSTKFGAAGFSTVFRMVWSRKL
jgi:hypothetical protein